MPRRDGTGPMRNGSKTGKGFGVCNGTNAARCGIGMGRGLGLGNRRGFGKGLGMDLTTGPAKQKTEQELLLEHKKLLEKELSSINQQLEGL